MTGKQLINFILDEDLVDEEVIAICCDYSEYENLEEFQRDYDGEYETIEDIEAVTSVIRVGDDGFIIQNF